MPTFTEIEKFLEERTKGEFKASMPRETKLAYILEHGNYVRNLAFSMRGVGRKAWGQFLWAYGLEEQVVLSPIKS